MNELPPEGVISRKEGEQAAELSHSEAAGAGTDAEVAAGEAAAIPASAGANLEVAQKKGKSINLSFKLWQAVLLLAVIAAGVFWGGVVIGKSFFWNQFDQTPLLERQYQNALAKVQQNPNSADNHVELGWVLYQKGEYNKALAEYKKALDINDKHYGAYYNLGVAYRQVEKYDLAISSLQKALEIAPKSFEAHYDLGMAYKANDKLEQGLQELKLAYKLNPGSTEIIYRIGETYEKLGNIQEAKYQYQSALEFDPKFALAEEGLKRLGGR